MYTCIIIAQYYYNYTDTILLQYRIAGNFHRVLIFVTIGSGPNPPKINLTGKKYAI